MLRWLWWLLIAPVRLPWLALVTLQERLWPSRVLQVRLKGPLADFDDDAPPWSRNPQTLFGLVSCFALAETDPRLRRVVLFVDELRTGLARAEELRAALARLVTSGKEVTVVANQLSLSTYWLSLGASRIVLAPVGELDVTGVASGFSLYKGLLAKVGVHAQMLARGRYKSMREVFAADEISDANREMLEQLTGDLYEQLVERVVEGRGMDASSVRSALDAGPLRAKEAQRLGLVDELEYEQQLRANWKRSKERTVSPARYARRKTRSWFPRRRHKVAVLEVSGAIATSGGGPRSLGRRSTTAPAFVAALRALEEDKSVKAILLRVDSPGGSALASDLMWQALSATKAQRPFVVSMANVAASGGYYVAGVKGAHVLASPCTITGSIGVVAGKFELSELYGKLGIGYELIARGKNAGYHSPLQRWSDDQLAKLQADIDALYEDFVSKMADGRALSFEAVDAVAQGRVWTGRQAASHQLVDTLGGLREAMDTVRRELGISPDAPLQWDSLTRPSLLNRLTLRGMSAVGLGRVDDALQSSPALRPLLDSPFFDDYAEERLWLRLPFDVRFD